MLILVQIKTHKRQIFLMWVTEDHPRNTFLIVLAVSSPSTGGNVMFCVVNQSIFLNVSHFLVSVVMIMLLLYIQINLSY